MASITHAANTSDRATHVSLFSPSHLPAAQGKAALGLLQNYINSPVLDGFFSCMHLRTEHLQSWTSSRVFLIQGEGWDRAAGTRCSLVPGSYRGGMWGRAARPSVPVELCPGSSVPLSIWVELGQDLLCSFGVCLELPCFVLFTFFLVSYSQLIIIYLFFL